MTPAEVVVIVLVLGLLALIALWALPRQRENARLAGCRANLMRIGIAVALYDRTAGVLPTVPALSAGRVASPGPLQAMLVALGLPDLAGLTDAAIPPTPQPSLVPGERLLPGFVCPSDPRATRAALYPAPTSYRATAGDEPTGGDGGFAPGRTLRLADIEDRDGTSFTAAFSERLLGTLRNGDPAPSNYMSTSGNLAPAGCPAAERGDWRGDAGSSWAEATWRSTLYNHALGPNAGPSCVRDDGTAGFLGTSSGHVPGVNVLMFDGSVRTVVPTVDRLVWKALATVGAPGAGAPPQPEANPKNPTP